MTINVVCGIIIKDKRILAMKRGKHKYDYLEYKYEFPGGKIERDENSKKALIRELKEELDLNFKPSDIKFFTEIKHDYPDFTIIMKAYFCFCRKCDFTMKEHLEYKYLKPEELETLQWADADLKIIKEIKRKSEYFSK